MTISLLHPSRGRAKIAAETFRNWLSKSSGQHKIEHILSIDLDDREIEAYKSQDYNHDWTFVLAGNNTCAVEATNKAAKVAHGDILIMLSDDFDCPQNWDVSIVNAYQGHTGVLKTFDGVQKWIVTLAIMDRAYYESQGYFYFPSYRHMFCDTEMTHKAELEGKLIVRNDLIFPHRHYSTGGSKKDETNTRADATWGQGEALYLKRVKECFGIPNVNPLQLSPLASQNVAWLKSKLR